MPYLCDSLNRGSVFQQKFHHFNSVLFAGNVERRETVLKILESIKKSPQKYCLQNLSIPFDTLWPLSLTFYDLFVSICPGVQGSLMWGCPFFIPTQRWGRLGWERGMGLWKIFPLPGSSHDGSEFEMVSLAPSPTPSVNTIYSVI